MDVEDIAPGLDFVRMLENEVRRCDVFLAVIGGRWLDLKDAQGRRMIDRDNDYVRIEIEAALRQNKHIIPVLVEGGEVPAMADLPPSIRGLARRSGIRLSHERFKSDVLDLVTSLRSALAEAHAERQKTEQVKLADVLKAHGRDDLLGERADPRVGVTSAKEKPGGRRFAFLAQDTVVDPKPVHADVDEVATEPPTRGPLAGAPERASTAHPPPGSRRGGPSTPSSATAAPSAADTDSGEETLIGGFVLPIPEPEARTSATAARPDAPTASHPTGAVRVHLATHVTLRLAGRRVASLGVMPLDGGAFTMGDEVYEAEKPQHRASVRPFVLMTHPVTRRLYADVLELPIAPGAGGPDAPVSQVNWVQAVSFCNRMSDAAGLTPAYRLFDGRGEEVRGHAAADSVNRIEWRLDTTGFRLPTEAEFEYAVRAGGDQTYFWGAQEEAAEDHAWFTQTASGPQPVKKKQPNAFGLYDLVGNVWEWCWDVRTDGYGIDDPTAASRLDIVTDDERVAERPNERSARQRVVRGGSFADPVALLRSAYRNWIHPNQRLPNVGFRCALAAPPSLRLTR